MVGSGGMEYRNATDYLYAGVPMLLTLLSALGWLLDKGMSVAALIIALMTFYRVQMRGAVISLRPRLIESVRLIGGQWNGLPAGWRFQCYVVAMNAGPRAGM